jgi:hypothetical protein
MWIIPAVPRDTVWLNQKGQESMTYTFNGQFVKWTAGLMWGRVADPMYLNSFGAWLPATIHPGCVSPYNHKEGKHFLKIFRRSAIQTGERH